MHTREIKYDDDMARAPIFRLYYSSARTPPKRKTQRSYVTSSPVSFHIGHVVLYSQNEFRKRGWDKEELNFFLRGKSDE